MRNEINDQTTLNEAKRWLSEQTEKGAICPCCEQRAQTYKRALNASMLSGLAVLRATTSPDFGFVHITELIKNSQSFASTGRGDFAKLSYWGLIEEQPNDNPTLRRSSGFWKITQKGVAFLDGRVEVPRYVKVYDGRCIGFSEKTIRFSEGLITQFSYAKLMSGALE